MFKMNWFLNTVSGNPLSFHKKEEDSLAFAKRASNNLNIPILHFKNDPVVFFKGKKVVDDLVATEFIRYDGSMSYTWDREEAIKRDELDFKTAVVYQKEYSFLDKAVDIVNEASEETKDEQKE